MGELMQVGDRVQGTHARKEFIGTVSEVRRREGRVEGVTIRLDAPIVIVTEKESREIIDLQVDGGRMLGLTKLSAKPIALDICCRMGGATVGLQRAGFYVIGIDIEPQPGYPGDEFILADGLNFLGEIPFGPHISDLGERPALIWESWPCQEGNTATAGNRARGIPDSHEQFIPRARELSNAISIPWVIEQPQSSRAGLIRRDLTLCMDMFKGDMPPPWVQKHRSFEFGCWPGALPEQPEHPAGPVRGGSMGPFPKPAGHATRIRGWRHGRSYPGDYVAGYGAGGGKGTTDEIAHAMRIDWMTDRFDLCEAIPPAYAEYIGRAFLAA